MNRVQDVHRHCSKLVLKEIPKRLATSRIEICLHSSISMQYHHFVVVFGSDGTDEDSSKVLGVALSKSSTQISKPVLG